jgi:hypothetical protein
VKKARIEDCGRLGRNLKDMNPMIAKKPAFHSESSAGPRGGMLRPGVDDYHV